MNSISRMQAILALLALIAVGCSSETKPTAETPTTARDVLDRMSKAYSEATSYADTGELRMQYDVGGQHFDENVSYALTFVRPNKLRLHIYQANVFCDGAQLQASLLDLPGQVLARPAPETLTQQSLAIDPVLTSVLRGTANESVPLTFLLDNQALARLLAQGDKPSLLASDKWDEQPCYRVRIPLGPDTLTLWIDEATYVLRRIDFPVQKLATDMQANLKASGLTEQIDSLKLTADLKGARFNERIDEVAFKFEPPQGAKQVSNFVVLPQPEPLSTLLGQQPPEFNFTGPDGQKITRDSLRGKVVLIEFWATWSEPCLQGLPALGRVADKFAGNDKVAVLAVNINAQPPKDASAKPATEGATDETPPATDEQVRSALAKAAPKLAPLRDPGDFANSVFIVERVPNRFILGPDGVVQDHEVGLNPKLAEELPARIEKLLAGDSLIDAARERFASRMREFQTQFQPVATGSDGAQTATIAAPSAPISLRLKKAWTNKDLKEPGNVLVTANTDGSPRLLVLDGWGAVVDLNEKGELKARHDLKLPQTPEQGIVTALRTGTAAGDKRYFLGVAAGRQQVFLYDDQFKLLRSYPDPDATSADGISDALLADLDGDGELEIVAGYFGVVGVHDVPLFGNRRWGNRTLANVLSMAVTEPDQAGRRRVLVADERGGLVPIDGEGRDGPPIVVNNRFVRSITAADLDDDSRMEYCCLAPRSQTEDTAIGIDSVGRELWNYPLPAGVHEHRALTAITSGNLLNTKTAQWVLAGADGSIHILAADGTPIDRFNYGESIAGIGVAAFEKPLLVVATRKGVEAWELERVE